VHAIDPVWGPLLEVYAFSEQRLQDTVGLKAPKIGRLNTWKKIRSHKWCLSPRIYGVFHVRMLGGNLTDYFVWTAAPLVPLA
jgi:hypothetical protein